MIPPRQLLPGGIMVLHRAVRRHRRRLPPIISPTMQEALPRDRFHRRVRVTPDVAEHEALDGSGNTKRPPILDILERTRRAEESVPRETGGGAGR